MDKIFLRIFIIILFLCMPLSVVQSQDGHQSIIRRYDFTDHTVKQLELPKKMREISGLATTDDDRIFGHDDERGILYEINSLNGNISKRFYFGHLVKKADFEGLEWVDGLFYLVTSEGKIIALPEGRDKESVDHDVYKSDLSRKYNIEGITYDPQNNTLLLACKDYPGKNLESYRAVYAFNIKNKRREKEPRFLIPEETISEILSVDGFKPSGMALHPLTRTFFVISAQEEAIVELSAGGKILGMSRLNKKIHRQPEGIAFTSTGMMIIADEGKKEGTLTFYGLKEEK